MKNNVTDNHIVQITSDIILTDLLLVFCSLTFIQWCICSLPCLWIKGCCCFKKCSSYKTKGTVDPKTGDVYVLLKHYTKYGSRRQNKDIEIRLCIEAKRTDSIQLLQNIGYSPSLRPTPVKIGPEPDGTINDNDSLIDNSPE